jgi:hypothetical protein
MEYRKWSMKVGIEMEYTKRMVRSGVYKEEVEYKVEYKEMEYRNGV